MANNTFINDKEIKQIAIKLQGFPKQIPGATASALNRTLNYTATLTKKEVTNIYSIKQKEVNSTLKKKRASKSSLNASIQSRGKTISLTKFPHNPKQFKAKNKKVKVKIKKQEGYKVIKTSPSAFVQTMNGGTHIWMREGKERNPVRLLRTLSIPQMISNDKVINKIQRMSGEKLKERINHEIEWRLSKL